MSFEGQKLGRYGEMLACEFLARRGYKIIDKNFRTRGGEIDIIAREGAVLIFVEVKTRTNNKFGEPEEAIDFYKQNKLAKTAEYYLAYRDAPETDYRIDSIAIEVDLRNKKAKIRHKKDIFFY
jgi:putative endonuclease